MKHLPITVLCLGMLTISMGWNHAADYQFKDFTLGEVIFGDKESISDLSGKVVVIDFWGVQCGPCIAKMPHLEALHQKYADKGLRIIGAEMQRSSESRIESIVKRTNVKFPIIKGCQNPVGVNRLPHMVIFDVDGKMVFNGYPDSSTESIIEKELERAVPGEVKPGEVASTRG